MRFWLAAMALATASACGADSGATTFLVNDQCQFEGPVAVEPGEVRFTLQRTGLGDYGAAVVTFEGDHGPDDLSAHFESVSGVWDDRPDWVTVEYFLETYDEDITPDDHMGETTLMDLGPGEHTVVCINFSDDRAEVAETVAVNPAG